jgi:hypothetical protein
MKRKIGRSKIAGRLAALLLAATCLTPLLPIMAKADGPVEELAETAAAAAAAAVAAAAASTATAPARRRLAMPLC